MTTGLKWTKADYDAWAKRRLERHREPNSAEYVASRHRLIEAGAAVKAKYGNVPTDGEASKRQAKRLSELRLMNEAGQIRGLARQPEYVLIPRQTRECGELVERKTTYIADFQYEEFTSKGWRLVVEDTKGYRTPDYVMKRKLMLAIHGIEVRET